jgi:sugar phosphate permease
MTGQGPPPAEPAPPSHPRHSGPFYGWYVAGALFFAMFLSIGMRQGFGIFVETWQAEFGVGVAAISLAASIGWFVNGSSQVLMGWLIDRIGGRIVITVAALLLGAAVLLMAAADSVLHLIVIYGLVMSLASAGLAGGPPGAVVVRWFRRKRGAAMSLLTSGGSIGGLVLVPFITYLFLWTTWRSAWLIAGAIVLVLGVPLLYLVLRDDPAELGLQPDGDDPVPGGGYLPAPAGPLLAHRWRDAFRSAPMWQLSIAYWVCGVTTASISVHYVRWAGAEGITPATAALAFGLLSGINAVGVLLVGPLSDRVPRKTLLGAVYLIRGVAFLLLVVLPGQAALWAFAIVGGASWLATVPLTTSLAADVYGVRHLGTLAGLINFAHQVGGALAVFLFGLVFDARGSYDYAFLACVATLVGAGLVSLSIRERRYSSRYATAAQPA